MAGLELATWPILSWPFKISALPDLSLVHVQKQQKGVVGDTSVDTCLHGESRASQNCKTLPGEGWGATVGKLHLMWEPWVPMASTTGLAANRPHFHAWVVRRAPSCHGRVDSASCCWWITGETTGDGHVWNHEFKRLFLSIYIAYVWCCLQKLHFLIRIVKIASLCLHHFECRAN